MADPTTSCVAHLQDSTLAAEGTRRGPVGLGHVAGLPGVVVTADTPRAALTAATTAIAAVLEVDPESFDLG